MARNMSLYGTPFRPAATDTFLAMREALSAAAGTGADVGSHPLSCLLPYLSSLRSSQQSIMSCFRPSRREGVAARNMFE